MKLATGRQKLPEKAVPLKITDSVFIIRIKNERIFKINQFSNHLIGIFL